MKQPSCLVKDACRENLSESDNSGTEVQIVTPATRPDDVSQIDETRRGSFNSDNFSQERPAWPSSWVALVSSIRMLNCIVFWEIFSGAAGLTSAFEANGWSLAPPIDILYCPDYDLLNPLFLGLCLGLIFERRIRLLHVGPPCSSFSMACNGCVSTMMRSVQFPEGRDSKPFQKPVGKGYPGECPCTSGCQIVPCHAPCWRSLVLGAALD